MRMPQKCVLLPAAAILVAACGRAPDASNPATLVEPQFAQVPAECSTASMATLARAYLSTPEQQAATENLRAMETACASDRASSVPFGWTVLGIMEAALEAGRAGDATKGASLTNLLIQYICRNSGCTETLTPVSAAAMGPQGIFATRAGGDLPVVAHGPVPFIDFDGDANLALWGLETSTDWAQATGAANILFYGAPGAIGDVSPDELSFGDLAYALHRFPKSTPFSDGELSVAVCYQSDVGLPLASLTNRLQRNGTLLVPYEPDCDAWWATLSTQTAGLSRVFTGMRDLAAWVLLPEPLAAFWAGAPASGGSPIDFSDFAPVAAEAGGHLAFLTPPADGTAGMALNTIRVQALSGLGTPIELVQIQLYVAGNSGTPAGATFCNPDAANPLGCNDIAYTRESSSGYDTHAEFTMSTLWKAGGYTICARALTSDEQPDFTFAEACAPMIHIKN